MFLPTSPRAVVSTFKTNFISKANNGVISMLYTLIKNATTSQQNLCLAFLDIKISIEGNGLCTSVYNKPTDSYSYLLYSSSYPSHVKNSFPFFYSFSDLVAYLVTTLIFPENQRQNASFLINLAILFLAFKRATIAPNKLIDSQHYKRLRRRIPIAIHSLSSYTSHHSPFVLICLWILNYMYYTIVSFVWFLSPYVSLQSNWAWKPSKLGLPISFSLWGFLSLFTL